MEEIVVPIALFSIIPVIVGLVVFNRRKAQEAMSEVIKEIVSKGEPLTPEIVQSLGVRQKPKHADLRTGLILIAIGIATIFLGGAIPEDEAQTVFGGLAMFPILVGAVLVGLWAFIGRKSD
ncbi:DUF6249 domain-containing protein [Fretibacter rubidus]|uniref:DUF6249 domain-containing protein n=1 Tax=Fretibacter rubidus TaxID=570162 RepID=UPI00352A699B